MLKMIQLRHVPDALHRQLKARAAIEGMSLSDYLIREMRKIAERPTLDEIKARLAAMGPSRLKNFADRDYPGGARPALISDVRVLDASVLVEILLQTPRRSS